MHAQVVRNDAPRLDQETILRHQAIKDCKAENLRISDGSASIKEEHWEILRRYRTRIFRQVEGHVLGVLLDSDVSGRRREVAKYFNVEVSTIKTHLENIHETLRGAGFPPRMFYAFRKRREYLKLQDVNMTPQQFRVFELFLGQGLTREQTAKRLKIDPATVKSHMENIRIAHNIQVLNQRLKQ